MGIIRIASGKTRWVGHDISCPTKGKILGVEEAGEDAEAGVFLGIIFESGAVEDFTILDYGLDFSGIVDLFGRFAEHIRDTRKIETVIQDGKILDRAALK